jgi:hypothetical protein
LYCTSAPGASARRTILALAGWPILRTQCCSSPSSPACWQGPAPPAPACGAELAAGSPLSAPSRGVSLGRSANPLPRTGARSLGRTRRHSLPDPWVTWPVHSRRIGIDDGSVCDK